MATAKRYSKRGQRIEQAIKKSGLTGVEIAKKIAKNDGEIKNLAPRISKLKTGKRLDDDLTKRVAPVISAAYPYLDSGRSEATLDDVEEVMISKKLTFHLTLQLPVRALWIMLHRGDTPLPSDSDVVRMAEEEIAGEVIRSIRDQADNDEDLYQRIERLAICIQTGLGAIQYGILNTLDELNRKWPDQETTTDPSSPEGQPGEAPRSIQRVVPSLTIIKRKPGEVAKGVPLHEWFEKGPLAPLITIPKRKEKPQPSCQPEKKKRQRKGDKSEMGSL